MSQGIQLEVVTPERRVLEAEVDEVILLARQNVDGCMAVLGKTDPRTHEAVSFLRDSLRRAGRIDDAEQVYREVVELRELTYGPDASKTCSAGVSRYAYYGR